MDIVRPFEGPWLINPNRVEVLGVPVDCVDMRGALAIVDDAISKNVHLTILAVNPEKVMTARRDPATMVSLQRAGLLIPDGIGVVWAVRLLTRKPIARVPGSELMPEICSLAARKSYRVFLYGAAPGVVDRVCRILLQNHPSLQIVGAQHGYLPDEHMSAFIEQIRASEADILFVALGSPRQELWIERHAPQLDVKVYQGVGGTFDVIAGDVKRAPPVFCRMHLEWLYRLMTEPKRITRQIVYPIFSIMVFWQKLKRSLPRLTRS